MGLSREMRRTLRPPAGCGKGETALAVECDSVVLPLSGWDWDMGASAVYTDASVRTRPCRRAFADVSVQARLHPSGKRQVFLAVAVNRDRNGRRQQTIGQRFIKRILDLLISCSIFLHDMIFKPE